MSRRIETGETGATRRVFAAAGGAAVVAAPENSPSADDYIGRLLKYIPAEIVGFYLVCAGLVSPDPAKPNYTFLWIVFGLGLVLVPVYFFITTQREGKAPLWSQIVLATIAYPVWVFAIGGPFASLTWRRGELAAVLLIFVTVVFGIYKPAEKK